MVGNIFLVLWWDQVVQPDVRMEMPIASILASFNLTFLALREYAADHGAPWLVERWTGLILALAVLACLLVPTITYTVEPSRASPSVAYGALFGVTAHAELFLLYRYRLPDLLA